MKKIPQVKSVMTPFPHSIEIGETIGNAKQMMEEHGIRHLPVTQDHKLIGVLSDRDVRVAWRVGANSPESTDLPVATVCSRSPYVVDMSAPLDDVVQEMADRALGCALVVRQDKLAGILTTTDVCRYLAGALRELAPGPGDDDVA